jgi:hypothetical protein
MPDRKIALPIPQYPGEIPLPRLQFRLSPARNCGTSLAPEPSKTTRSGTVERRIKGLIYASDALIMVDPAKNMRQNLRMRCVE